MKKIEWLKKVRHAVTKDEENKPYRVDHFHVTIEDVVDKINEIIEFLNKKEEKEEMEYKQKDYMIFYKNNV